MRVSKWGNSLAVRIPADIAEKLSLREGDEIKMLPFSGSEYLVKRQMTRQEAIDAIRKAGSPLPKGFRFNRLEIHDRSR
ncbi:MAG TPA: AbrB/MazE/SpoVT family DNA-binding domain-containing protein [Bryobacteraceae bacterium]|nr:AbrB/MazE/SpoVT family DNA-binding domain-containing protein [Bryobacteraceae bacterium]